MSVLSINVSLNNFSGHLGVIYTLNIFTLDSFDAFLCNKTIRDSPVRNTRLALTANICVV